MKSPTARGFALLEGNTLSLADFDVNNSEQMAALHKQYKDNRSLQFTLLKDRILQQIQQDSGYLQSDAFNHVDIYRSIQGVSGTPGKETKYHQRLSFNYQSSLGTDAYIVELLRHKKIKLSHIDYENNVEQFLQKALFNSKSGERTRAIVDVNATFTGLGNLEVAQAIASFTRANPNFFADKLKYVLYFNTDQVLCALDINKPEISILLGTSDEKEISRLLRVNPAERFTFYDQVHTIGTDIKQADTAHALILMDIKDESDGFDPFAQGNLRMRGISQRQSNELILPTRVQGISYDELIARLEENQQRELPLDNLFSAKAQMTNLLRRSCLSMLQKLPSEKAEKKAALALKFADFFKEVPSQDLFALYGSISKKQNVSDIFEIFKNQLVDLWKQCHKKASIDLTEIAVEEIEAKLQTIIDIAIPNCLEEYEEVLNASAKEVQIQKMIQKQIERVELKDFFDPNLTAAYPREWCSFDYKKNLILELNTICQSGSLFKPNLKVSKNYVETYQSQVLPIKDAKQILNGFLKPVLLIWYHYSYNENNEKLLEATIVMPLEVKSLAKLFKENDGNWISTIENTVVAGKSPKNIVDEKNYQSLREQVRFFNGDFLSLVEQETPLIWLQENTEEKLNFFERNLQCLRPGSELGLHQLKTALSQANVSGYEYIAQYPFQDLTQTDWKAVFPKIIPVQAAEYRRVAEAFHFINEHWLDENLVLGDIEQQFSLAMNSLCYINDHLKTLAKFKQAIKETLCYRQPFIQRLSKKESDFAVFLGMSLENFYKRQAIDPQTTDLSDPKWMLASLAAVNYLRAHPALKGKKDPFAKTIEELAIASTHLKFLEKIIKEELLSKKLIKNILNNKCCDESIVKQLLDLDLPLKKMDQTLLAKKCNTIHLAETLLLKDLNKKAYRVLSKYAFLQPFHLLDILKKPIGKNTLKNIFKHRNSNPGVQEALFKHKDFNLSLLKTLVFKNRLTPETILKILDNSKNVDEDFLIFILKSFPNSPEILLAVFNNKQFKTFTRLADFLLNNPSTDEQSALSFAGMLDLADQETLERLADYRETNKLSKDFRRLLGKKCNQENLLWLFLKRQDNADLLDEMLLNTAEFKFNENELLLILKRAKASTTLPLIYNYQKATLKIKEQVLKHKALSSEFIEFLLENNQLDDQKLIQILSSTTDLSVNLQKTLILNTSNPEVLLALVRPNLYISLLGHIISKPEFSPAIAQRSLQNYSPTEYLLLQIANIAFSKIKLEKEWEPCLLEVFEQCRFSKFTVDKLRAIIRQNSANLNAFMAFKVISIFGKDMANYVLAEKMIEDSSESEFKILLEPSCEISEKMQLELVRRCDTKELIDSFLEKNNLHENTYFALLQKKILSAKQLLTISMNIKSKANLQALHNHPAATDNVKKAVYVSGYLTSELLLKLNINDEDWLLVLKHPAAIDRKVLTAVAKTTKSPLVLAEVVKNLKTNCDILDLVINNDHFSYELAELIIHNWHDWPTSTIKIYLEKAFENCAHASGQEQEKWEECLIKLFLKYLNNFNQAEILLFLKKKQIQLPTVGLLLLRVYGKDLIENLPVNKMILIADNRDLSFFVDLDLSGQLAEESLTLLADICQDFQMISKFVERPELNANILQIVLAKPLPYYTLNKALTHPALTPADQQFWFDNMAEKQKIRKEELLNNPDLNLKLAVSLEALRLKACEHVFTALTNDEYKPVAEAAINLYNELHQEMDDYLNKKTKPLEFHVNCKNAINDALPVLGTHRGYKQLCMDILNLILNVITLRFAWSNQWRFFEMKTDTVKTVDEFNENIENFHLDQAKNI